MVKKQTLIIKISYVHKYTAHFLKYKQKKNFINTKLKFRILYSALNLSVHKNSEAQIYNIRSTQMQIVEINNQNKYIYI